MPPGTLTSMKLTIFYDPPELEHPLLQEVEAETADMAVQEKAH